MARNRLEIRLDLIQKNFQLINASVNPLETMAVLKADAYGLGVIPLRDALQKAGCKKFGVADVNEAKEIYSEEIEVYILGDLLPEEIPEAVKYDFKVPVTSFTNASLLSNEAATQGKTILCQILLDTGMGRLGIESSQAVDIINKIAQLPHLKLDGIYSHFPHAYGDDQFSQEQIEKVKSIISELESNNISFNEVHIANSDGIHNISSAIRAPFNVARTGINLYGCFDLEGQRTLELDQAVTLISRLVAVRDLPEGFSIGYGRTYRLDRPKRIGTVAIGYADGLPIGLSNNGNLIIRGQKCPIIGRVSMDYTTVDLSNLPDAEAGDDVLCLGSEIPVSEWATAESTITYDIICSIGNRVERVYLDDESR